MKKIIASLSLNNFGGIGITEIEHGIEDKVKYYFLDDEEEYEAILEYDEDDELGFYAVDEMFYKLDEFMRIDFTPYALDGLY